MKDFDLEHIGKQMPYCVPEGFFESFPDRVMQRIAARKRARRRRMWLGIGTSVAAAMVAGIVFFGGKSGSSLYPSDSYEEVFTNISDKMDAYVGRLSDEELNELYDYYAADVTLTLYAEE